MDLLKTEFHEFDRKGKKALSVHCPFCQKEAFARFHPSEVYRHDCLDGSTVFFLNGFVMTGVCQYIYNTEHEPHHGTTRN